MLKPKFELKAAFVLLLAIGSVYWGFQLLQDSILEPRLAQSTNMTGPSPPEASSRTVKTVSQIPQTSEAEFARRREQVRKVCKSPDNQNFKGGVNGIFTHAKSGFIFCSIPKAGCTFWKRVFYVLGKNPQNKATTDGMFDIPRFELHTKKSGVGYGVPYSPKLHSFQNYSTRLTVTRDPFSRLLSTFLDKIYLPDFWRKVEIKKNRNNRLVQKGDFLRQHFDLMAMKFEPKNLSTSKCRKYQTFSDFVNFSFTVRDPHWSPISSICNPCIFNVTHVSRMETFTEDARAILSKMEHRYLLDELSSSTQVDKELEMIVDFNYHKVLAKPDNSFFNSCITAKELAYRLWYNFRWRGYIDPDVDYQIPNFSNPDRVKADLMFQIGRARESGLKKPESLKKAKRDFKEMAFRTLGKDLFDKIIEKYKLDLELFGYNDVRDKMYKLYDKKLP